MPTPQHLRISTADPRAEKRERVEKALANPKYKDTPARALARLLGVDESMVRRHRNAMMPKPKKKPASKAAGRKK